MLSISWSVLKIVKNDGKHITDQCQYCPKMDSEPKGSTGNFLNHITYY